MKKTIVIILGLLCLSVILLYILSSKFNFNLKNSDNPQQEVINSYSECVAAGNPILESYPSQCIAEDGRHFIQEIHTFDYSFFENNQAKYISFQDWNARIASKDELPEGISLELGSLECVSESNQASSLPERIYPSQIADQDYCVKAISEGAAGSVYTTYSYTTVINGNLIILDFTARFSNCQLYDEPERSECASERENFNLDALVNAVVESAF